MVEAAEHLRVLNGAGQEGEAGEVSVEAVLVAVLGPLPAGADRDLGRHAGDLVQGPVVDDLGVVGALWLPPDDEEQRQ